MATTTAPVRRRRPRRSGIQGREAVAGWLFVAPVLVILGLFLVLPVAMAAWVSVSDWTGRGSPFSSDVGFVGAQNYRTLMVDGGLATQDFGTAMRNNAWYVLLVVPTQTAISLFLAVMVNRRILRGRGFFRTAFYFPSVTSSVAIVVLWLFLFSASGAVNKLLSFIGIAGPNWFNDPRGIVHVTLGAIGVDAPAAGLLAEHGFLGITWWQWLAGPSFAMSAFILMAVFTTSGTFMLLFIAALQNISGEVEEAAMMDGTTAWQRFRLVTLPMLRPTLFTVLTLGLIGAWQVFDQIYTGTQGGPSKTTLTPAFLSYQASFNNGRWGQGAAIAFVLFALIVVLTVAQRFILRESDTVPRRKRFVRTPPVPTLTDEKSST
ncbi:carbohydrate ABC transporter permease [Pengzhenrongella sicca]|uniref:Sugar ABC transporter permease n=1 Tax=Pengzhenrongella sicca TaxID=2819238 RepID=A0A8A4ZBR7_9MICO|nr:sugar ABC transporter permease [Pengzhenrongella sicca]QTE28323.1 sugar ABC transporter permease [Pengzhenrongella sicca]